RDVVPVDTTREARPSRELRLAGDSAQLEVGIPGAREVLDPPHRDVLRLQLEPIGAGLPALQGEVALGPDAAASQGRGGIPDLHALPRQGEAGLDVAQGFRPVAQEQIAAVNGTVPDESGRRQSARGAHRELECPGELADLGPRGAEGSQGYLARRAS